MKKNSWKTVLHSNNKQTQTAEQFVISLQREWVREWERELTIFALQNAGHNLHCAASFAATLQLAAPCRCWYPRRRSQPHSPRPASEPWTGCSRSSQVHQFSIFPQMLFKNHYVLGLALTLTVCISKLLATLSIFSTLLSCSKIFMLNLVGFHVLDVQNPSLKPGFFVTMLLVALCFLTLFFEFFG